MATQLESFCGSVFWDNNLVWNTTTPDFPECFQNTVLLWISCGSLWILSPLEIYYIVKQVYQRIPWSALNVSKTVLGLMLICANIAQLIYTSVSSFQEVEVFPADFWAPAIKSLTFILALALMLAGKVRGLHSSGVLFIFWTFMSLAGIVTYRTRITQALAEEEVSDIFLFSLTAISVPLILAQLVLSSFTEKVIPHKDEDKKASPLKQASFLSQIFFGWFERLVWKGYRKELTEKDLWTLDPEYVSEDAYEEFVKHWVPQEKQSIDDTISGRKNFEQSPSIFSVLWKMNRFDFNMAIFLKLFADALMFVNPLMLKMLIDFVASKDEQSWHGYLYTVIILCASILQSMITHNYFFRLQAIGIRARATVIAAIYRKFLRMSTASKRTSTTGEIVNLMSVDAQRLHDFWPYVGYAVTTPIIVGVALYMLWDLLGPSVFAGLCVIIIMIPTNIYLAGRVSKMQTELMKQKDSRTKVMNEILSGIKVLKLYAWEMSFYDQITEIRARELRMLKKFLYLNSITTLLFQFTPFLISISTFATYVLIDENNILDASKAFVSLSLFDLLRYPLTYVPIVISYTIQAMISIRRLNKYMRNPELDPDQVAEATPDEDPVIVKNASFGWDVDDEAALQDINLNITKGSLIAVVGTVGSGKSSLISAILGEMDKQTGRVKRQNSVAYVSQQAWIQNSTVCQNILFYRTMDEKKYDAVIDACALKPDLEILPGGDQTEIGEKGINLSGGQKQRISLARAVYNDAELYLLDDPLSAVDSHVGKHIFEKVIGPEGLLKEKTRVLVTHSLVHLPFVDSIIVMSNGTISEMGSYRDLLEAGGAFADFIMTYLKDETEMGEVEVAELLEIQENILPHIENPELKRKLSVRISRALSSDEETYTEGTKSSGRWSFSDRRQSSGTAEIKRIESQISKEIIKKKAAFITQTEQLESGSVGWYVYYYYFKSNGFWFCAIAALMLVVSWAAAVGSNVWLSYWSGDKPLPDGSQDVPLRDLRLGIYAGLGSTQAIFGLIASFVLVLANIRASTILHNDMLTNILRSPMSFFDITPLGRIMNRFSRDIDIVDSTVPSFIRPLGDSLLQIIGVIIVISMGSPMFLAILVPLGIVYYLVQRVFISSTRQLKRIESVTRSPIFSHFSETISGLSTIRAYRQQREFTENSDKKVDFNHKASYPFLVAKRWLAIRLDLVGATVVFAAALFAVIGKNTMDPGTAGLSLSYGLSVTFVLTLMVRYWTELESNSVSLERIKEYTEITTEAPWEMEEFKPTSSWPDEGNIQFRDYSTRYREGLDPVLKRISCDIRSGEKIGIVGRTGAGKSSLTLALFRIIEKTTGTITIDGIDISKLGLYDLRSRLTIIPQDPVLFSGNLRMNLDPFKTYNDNEVWQALEHSHLKEFVINLPGGLHHEISEGGENLSVGQRQLVCLARALLRKTKVLILDEATAAVDLETDDLIQATIRKEFSDCTVLTIAHRLNTIMDSSRVMVLVNGIIQEFDTPSNLLQNHRSVFYSMAKDAGMV